MLYYVRTLYGLQMKVPINGTLFTIEEVDGPIVRSGREFPVQIRYAARQIRLSRSVPEGLKKYVLAAAISEACLRYRIPLIRPNWEKSP